MTRVILHIGPDPNVSRDFERNATANHAAWARQSWLFPTGMGQHGQTALFLAALDPDHVDPIRAARGLAPEDRQGSFADGLRAKLKDLSALSPQTIVLSCDLLGRDLIRTTELARLKSLLDPISDNVDVLATIPEPTDGFASHWASQVLWGRVTPIEDDVALTRPRDPKAAKPEVNYFPELESPPQWRDPDMFLRRWRAVFDKVILATSYESFHRALEIPGLPITPETEIEPSAQTLARALALNPLIQSALARGLILPRKNRAKAMAQLAVSGAPIDRRAIAVALADPENAPTILPPVHDFDPAEMMARLVPKMLRLTRAADIGERRAAPQRAEPSANLPASVQDSFSRLVHSRYAPHNRIAPKHAGELTFSEPTRPDPPHPERVIVACMKDEGPYLLEWLAYHRVIGFDHVLVYTNDCSDGTDKLLDRLATYGWVTHIDNSDWHGKSPQQAALNHAATLPLVQAAEWVAHIDTDEFINIRCGNGTLDDLFLRCPDGTHFALTWRLFGSNGVTHIEDTPVIEQFTRCAPAFCPKPHTAWGFKTLGKQIGAYKKLSCHRPTKPVAARIGDVHWVNGSGASMGPEIAQRGWRSNIKTIGYDLVQLNHYAVRSRDNFLVKRKRGRALHVDRQIGHNYWVRMDWNDHEDTSILRNRPRLASALDALKSDKDIARLHAQAVAWHREQAQALQNDAAFGALVKEIASVRLTQSERAAYAMTLDMET